MKKAETRSNKMNSLLRLASRWEFQLFIIILILMSFGSTLSPYFIDLKNQIQNSKNFNGNSNYGAANDLDHYCNWQR